MADNIKMLHEIKFATRQRLQFIEVMAYYTGMISRSMLAKAYGISDPAATKDLKLYNDLAPDNLEYNPSVFSFVPTDKFDEVKKTYNAVYREHFPNRQLRAGNVIPAVTARGFARFFPQWNDGEHFLLRI